jgi:hypothetical protein
MAVMFLLAIAPAFGADTGAPVTLPVKRVVLYKHGVGYFEHAGKISGTQTVTFSFSAPEMNDVLKSLTAIDYSGGKITTIGYDTKAPQDRLLAQFGFVLPDAGALTALLARLRGATIELTVGQTTTKGSIIGVETRQESRGDKVVDVAVLTVLTDASQLFSVPLREITGLRFTDDALSKDLGRYLEILRDGYHRDRKLVSLRAEGDGERDLFVSYVLETPVWKVSYRLLVNDTGPALLQGWAIVDNTSQTDWENVELSLVSGLPVSFVQDLYSPLYRRRPVVRMEEELALAPQTHEGGWTEAEKAKEVAAADEGGDEDRADKFASKRKTPIAVGRGARNANAPVPAPGPAAAGPKPTMAEALADQGPETSVRELGELFEYKIPHPISVAKDRSALIPILTSKIDAKKVSLYNAAARAANPLAAILLTNNTGLTLEGGPIQVLEKETYAGEALIETIKTGDHRYITYAVDLALNVDTQQGSSNERIVRVAFLNGAMVAENEQLKTTNYTIRSGDQAARDVVIEHPRVPNYTLVKPEKPLETTPTLYRLALAVPAGKTVVFPVQEKTIVSTSVSIGNVTTQDLDLYLSRKMLSPEMEQALRKILDVRAKIADLTRQIDDRKREAAAIATDEDRIRKNLGSLGTTGSEQELRSRYVAQLGKNEDRLGTLKQEQDKLEAERNTVQAQLDQMIRGLALEYRP